MSQPQPHCELRHITKRFGGVQALTDVSLSIERGEIHALVGENGAGKSTLGKIIAGAHRPDSGEMLVDAQPVAFAAPRDALRHGVTIIAQEPTLVPRLSVVDNVFLGMEGGRAGVLSRRVMRRRFDELVEGAEISLPASSLAGSLSVADQQKLEILRAIARGASLLVMDEPSSALTADESERLFHAVRSLRDQGTTIVYVSHFLEEVLALADTVTVLRDGRLVKTVPAPSETPQSLINAMLGRSLETTFPPKQYPAPGAPVVLSVRELANPPIVEDVSFELRAGEILGLAGLVGSGRSEVARAIFGADRRTHGVIEVAGVGVSVHTPRDAMQVGIALLPEDRKAQGLFMLRSVTDNVTVANLGAVGHLGAISARRQRRASRDLVERVDVRSAGIGAKVSTLSGGNQQKVLLAKWMFRQPRILIADEPTRGVDVGAKRAIYELLHALAADGMAILLISSEHEEVLGLAHRVLVMREGRIVAELEGEEMTEEAVLRAAFAQEDNLVSNRGA